MRMIGNVARTCHRDTQEKTLQAQRQGSRMCTLANVTDRSACAHSQEYPNIKRTYVEHDARFVNGRPTLVLITRRIIWETAINLLPDICEYQSLINIL